MADDYVGDYVDTRLDLRPEVVGVHIANGWLEGCENNSPDDLQHAVMRLASGLGSTVELLHGDEAALALAETFREAATHIEQRLGERIHRGVRNMRRASV